MTIVAASTHEVLDVMRFDPQIASRFEQMELPVWTESVELRRFVAGYLAMLPVRKAPSAIDQRFIEHLLALTDGVTGRIIDPLRRAAIDALSHKSRSLREAAYLLYLVQVANFLLQLQIDDPIRTIRRIRTHGSHNKTAEGFSPQLSSGSHNRRGMPSRVTGTP